MIFTIGSNSFVYSYAMQNKLDGMLVLISIFALYKKKNS